MIPLSSEQGRQHTSLYNCIASAHLSSSGLTRSIMSRSTAELEMTLLEQGIRVFCTRSLYSTGASWMSVDIVTFTFDKCLFFLSISLYTLSEITEENRINIVLKLISSTIIFQELSALFVSQLEAYFIQNPSLNMIQLTLKFLLQI